jgi:hypothetical protein
MCFSSVPPGKFRDGNTWYLTLELGHILNRFCFIVHYHRVIPRCEFIATPNDTLSASIFTRIGIEAILGYRGEKPATYRPIRSSAEV